MPFSVFCWERRDDYGGHSSVVERRLVEPNVEGSIPSGRPSHFAL